MLKMYAGISILVVAIAIMGCNKGSEGGILAKVNRTNITEAEFKRQLGQLTPQMQQAVASDPKARKDFLEDLIGIELVIQEAKRQGLDKDAEYKKNVEQQRKELEEYKKKLEQQMQDAAKNELFNSVLKKDLGDKLSKVPTPTDKEVSDYYNKNKELIRTSAGKQLSLKEVEPQLKQRLIQEKRRDLYLEYAKGLRTKANVSIDEKALDTAMTAVPKPEADMSGLTVTKIPTPEQKETKK